MDSFGPHEKSGKWVKWCWPAVSTSSQGPHHSGPGARLGAPPSPGPLLPASLPCPAQLWGQGGDLGVRQIAHSARRLLKLSLNATAREKGRDSGNPRVSGSECSSRPLPTPGGWHCPRLISAAKGAQGLSVWAVPWDYYNLGPKAPAPTRPADLAALTSPLPAASEGVGDQPVSSSAAVQAQSQSPQRL